MWSTPYPVRFIPRKWTWYPLHWRLGGLRSRSGWVRKISPDQFRFPDCQLVANRCKDWAVPITVTFMSLENVVLLVTDPSPYKIGLYHHNIPPEISFEAQYLSRHNFLEININQKTGSIVTERHVLLHERS
jgi:hypothetical protein